MTTIDRFHRMAKIVVADFVRNYDSEYGTNELCVNEPVSEFKR